MTLAQEINEMIRFVMLNLKITSANPTFTNTVKDIIGFQERDLTPALREEVEKIVKDLGQRGQVSIGGNIPGKVTKGMEWLGSTPEIGGAKVPKGMLKKILERDLGVGKAREALNFMINPQAMIGGQIGKLARGGGPLGAAILLALAAPHIITALTKMLTRRGSFFDLTFRNIMDNRINALRTRESQQEIRRGIEGKSQVILTTRAGTVDPVFSYNTYEQINNNELEFEKIHQVRSVFTGP